MEQPMRAIFHDVFRYDRRPRQAVAFVVQPGEHNLPRDVVEAAIAAGKATAVEQKMRRKPLKKKASNPI